MRPPNNLEIKIFQTLKSLRIKVQVTVLQSTNGMQSGPDVFDKSRLIITFLTNLGVTEILCSFKLDFERKACKEIPESSRFESLENVLANNLAVSDAKANTSSALNREGVADLPFREHP